jgi:hypothetical protein
LDPDKVQRCTCGQIFLAIYSNEASVFKYSIFVETNKQKEKKMAWGPKYNMSNTFLSTFAYAFLIYFLLLEQIFKKH